MNTEEKNSDSEPRTVTGQTRKPVRVTRVLLIVLFAVPALTFFIFFLSEIRSHYIVNQRWRQVASLENSTTADDFSLPLQSPNVEPMMLIDEPGIENGQFYRAEQVVIPNETLVIGVEVAGQFRAYLQGGMNDMDQHILHDNFNGQRITMTYCDKSDCARAFLRGDLDPEKFHMGGFSGKGMWLLINDQRYDQLDKNTPLEDYPLSRMTWGEWKTEHPETTIYVGIGLSYTQTLRDGDEELPQGTFYRD